MAGSAERGSASGLTALVVLATLAGGGLWYSQHGSPAPTPVSVVTGTPIVPAALSVPAIGVDAPVEARGSQQYENPFTGQPVVGYGVPESMVTTSWWSDGPQPGSGQMAVVLGHDVPGAGVGVFDDIDQLQPGDAVVLTDAAGTQLQLQVLEPPVTGLDKATSALSDVLNGHPADADVALVTCGGDYDDALGASEQNVVVFASVV